MVAPHSMFSLEVANDRLDSFTAFESVGILLLIHPQWHAGSSAGACWILAMGNRSFCKETALTIAVSCNPSRPNPPHC